MRKATDITGKVFGRLTAIEPTEQRKCGAVVWKCNCECGNVEVYVSRSQLTCGKSKSCGCLRSEKVAEKNKEIKKKDITGQKFGRLTAVRPTNIRNNGYIIWECKCECGKKEVYVNLHNLTRGDTLSCGCLNSEIAKGNATQNLSEFKKNNFIASTRLDIINNKKLMKNNTTGHTGVCLRKENNKYTARIQFQGKKHCLGSYYTKEEAVKIREEAESKLYGDFLKWYNSIKANDSQKGEING